MHLVAYSTDDRCELTCVCDLNEERARQMAEKYRCDWTTDIAELAAAVDGASVATPDFAHLASRPRTDRGRHACPDGEAADDRRRGGRAPGRRRARAGREADGQLLATLEPEISGGAGSDDLGPHGRVRHGLCPVEQHDQRADQHARLGHAIRSGVVPLSPHHRRRALDPGPGDHPGLRGGPQRRAHRPWYRRLRRDPGGRAFWGRVRDLRNLLGDSRTPGHRSSIPR